MVCVPPRVSDNRSLDEFLSGDDGEPPAGAEGGPAGGTEPGGDVPEGTDGDAGACDASTGTDGGRTEGDPAGVDPIAATYGWSPGGAACSACGAVVEERWRDGDGLVCADCKDW